ncbi:hypothetical protein Glove_1g45 [Diversispora epigaea]|uniref:Uncharacterized protein n=1 Tax=Diversispora epigaea TaxID=1348612 RepID=A0A397K0I1_9GLOM|nr:hypothetical protein Glove_1g45 [Diversispora epigaea]
MDYVKLLEEILSSEFINAIRFFKKAEFTFSQKEEAEKVLFGALEIIESKGGIHVVTAKRLLRNFDNFIGSFNVQQYWSGLKVREEKTATNTAQIILQEKEEQNACQIRSNILEENIQLLRKRSASQEVDSGDQSKKRKRLTKNMSGQKVESFSGLITDFEFHGLSDDQENFENNEENEYNFDLPNNQEGVEYDEEVKNLLDESEIRLPEFSAILTDFKTYQHEKKNILSENGIMDLSPCSEFVLLHLEETKYVTLIKKVFEPIDKIFPDEADEFLINFFSEKLSEQQWEDKIESLMEVNPKQNKFIIKLKRLIIETLPIFFDSYKLMSDNPLKNKDMTEEEYMNTYIHPILKKSLIRFSDIRYVPGSKAIKASTYRKTVMNQKGSADRADGISYTSNQQSSYEISVTEGSRPYVTEKNKDTCDFIQNSRAAKDMINFAVTQEVLHKRPLPSGFRTFMVQV